MKAAAAQRVPNQWLGVLPYAPSLITHGAGHHMRILFIHKNFPAQFGRVADWLVDQGWDVTFATARKDARSSKLRLVPFSEHRTPSEKIHHYLQGTENSVIAGQGMMRTALALRKQGYMPDIVVAHSGWGVGAYIKDVWPETKFVQYAEWYYNYPHADSTAYTAPSDPFEAAAKARTRNLPFWLDFSAADATICPTRHQADQFPDKLQPLITVLHDGFDTITHAPGARSSAVLSEYGIPPHAPLVTYIARGMEPTRGFPELMKTLDALQKNRPDMHAIIVADDRVAYGAKQEGFSWKEYMLSQLDLDTSRLHFAGLVPRRRMVEILQSSDAHLYLSVPFVLSWSFIEAMACGAPMVASRSASVEEFMTHGESGLLVDPQDIASVTSAVEFLLEDPFQARAFGHAARQKIASEFDGPRVIFPATAAFFESLLDADPAAQTAAAGQTDPAAQEDETEPDQDARADTSDRVA